MDIKEIKKHKRETERAIQRLIEDFEDRTEMYITEVELYADDKEKKRKTNIHLKAVLGF